MGSAARKCSRFRVASAAVVTHMAPVDSQSGTDLGGCEGSVGSARNVMRGQGLEVLAPDRLSDRIPAHFP
jgi:hypothetical protein